MAGYQFGGVVTLLADKDTLVRGAVRSMLRNSGFREIRVGATVFDLEEQICEPDTDLVISEIDLTGGDLCELVRRVRHHRTRANPFLPFIALTGEPSPELVGNIMDAGIDTLLAKPMSTQQLQNRIVSLIRARKPFVVTSDYIGPDRRGDDERESEVELLEVPNTLQIKALGGQIDSEIQARIDAMIAKINLQKIERNQDFLSWVIAELAPEFNAGVYTPNAGRRLERVMVMAEDIHRRVHDTKYDHVADLCRALIAVCSEILDSPGMPQRRSLLLIQPLGQAIEKGFESGTADAARAIFRSLGD